MVRDPGLEDTMRAALRARLPAGAALGEKPMFGGLCWLVDGNMVGAAREGRVMLRVGRPAEAAALTLPGVTPMMQGGRRMAGYVWCEAGAFEGATRAALLDLAATCVTALPPKAARA